MFGRDRRRRIHRGVGLRQRLMRRRDRLRELTVELIELLLRVGLALGFGRRGGRPDLVRDLRHALAARGRSLARRVHFDVREFVVLLDGRDDGLRLDALRRRWRRRRFRRLLGLRQHDGHRPLLRFGLFQANDVGLRQLRGLQACELRQRLHDGARKQTVQRATGEVDHQREHEPDEKIAPRSRAASRADHVLGDNVPRTTVVP